MRRLHARGPTALAARRAPYPGSGRVLALFAFTLAVFVAGCASSRPPEVATEVPDAANATPEAPAPATEAPVSAPPAPAPTAGIFTEGQAERGRTAFDETCSDCHTTSEFRGRTFQSNWGRRTVYSFFRTIRSTMPDDDPGGLGEEVYLDVVSYILSINGHAAGTSELAADSPMRAVRMAPPDPNP